MNDSHPPKAKAILIGWDGAPWEYLNPLLAENRLPHLARLLARSSRATLTSTIPPFTNIAWPAMITGRTPAGTGIFDGAKAAPGSYTAIPTNLTRFHGTAVWQWLNHHGCRTAVLNVPMTYPAPAVDGVFVSGFDSPQGAADAAYPRDVLAQWRRAGHPYTLLDDEIALMRQQNPHHDRGNLETFIQGWIDLSRAQGRHAAWLWQQGDLDLLFVVFSGSDSVNHRTRSFDQIARVYAAMDEALGEILAAADADTTICLLSDHGSTPAYRYISLYRALADAGWLHFRPQVADRFWQRLPGPLGNAAARLWQKLPGAWKRPLSWPLLRWDGRLAAAYDNIDWTRTQVYTRSGMGLLYLNHADQRPQGTVTAAAAPALRTAVRDHFLALRDEAGKPLFADVLVGADVYPDANPADDPPDLILRPAQWSDHLITGYPSDPLIRPIPDAREYGTHTPDGVLLLAGPIVRADHDIGRAELIDVTPTLYALLGLPVPRTVNGRVLHQVSATPLSVAYVEDDTAAAAPAADLANAAEIMQRLEDLGYL